MHTHDAFRNEDCHGACSVGCCSALAGVRSEIGDRLKAGIRAGVGGDMCM